MTVAFLGMLAELVGSQDPLLMPIVSVDRGRKHTVENRDLSKETWVVI